MIKNNPPKISANVVPIAPETGTPLAVEGWLLRVAPLEPLKEEEVDEIFGVAVGVGVAVVVAEVVAPPIGYGLVVPNGVAVGVGVGVVARATKLLDFGATVQVRVNVTSWFVSGSV